MARKQATAAEAQAVKQVHQKVTELLDALRDARAAIHHETLSALINRQIDRQLEAEEQLRDAYVESVGQPIQDPY